MELVFSGWFYCESFDAREVYVDGACHWLVFAGTDPLELTLLSFDLSDEAFLITPIGDIPYTHLAFQACLTVLNGSIALLSHNDEYGNDITLTISILGEVGVNESWIKLYICGPFSIYWPPVGFGKKGYIFFRKKDNKLACVDLSTQEIEEIGITCCAEENYFRIGLYKESLLSIGGLSN
ncbi:uncharacterized protein LOC131648506 [Vicia villosa]|uniref:uncharacterized protein LOC131648506 n=1 Tax=Vicia villosa TaxID=3911 RepID=UPI00273AA313|nr:uncharacterized protein LOC131648506 [Vicia villosa]